MAVHYAVFGNPIAHSKSPLIHAEFARQTGQDMDYRAILAPLDDFAGAVAAFREQGGAGANVTVPFKHQAYQLVSRHTERARAAEAVNTFTAQVRDVIFRGEGYRLTLTSGGHTLSFHTGQALPPGWQGRLAVNADSLWCLHEGEAAPHD